MLTPTRIQELAARTGVRKVAVQNFLMTLRGMTEGQALLNLKQDATSYRWDSSTQKAIREGITEFFAK